MQSDEMLKGKKLSMERELFAKNAHFIEGDKRWKVGSFRASHQDRLPEERKRKAIKNRVQTRMFPKLNTDRFCLDWLLQ